MDLKVEVMEINGTELKVLALQSYYQIYKYDFEKDTSLASRPAWSNQGYVCKNLIWLNEESEEIGFIGISACRIFILSEIQYLKVSNVLPAKGPGFTEMVAVLKPNNKNVDERVIYFDRGAYFDPQELEMIRLFTNLNIIISPDGYDC